MDVNPFAYAAFFGEYACGRRRNEKHLNSARAWFKFTEAISKLQLRQNGDPLLMQLKSEAL